MLVTSDAVTGGVLWKKMLPEACNFIKKETQAQMFSIEFCEIFKNTLFTEHIRTTTSFTCFITCLSKNLVLKYSYLFC